jgi:hypothetical protein
MKLSLLLIPILCLAACGNHTKIKYHEVSRAELVELTGSPDPYGMAVRKDMEYVVYCDIYLMPQYEYIRPACFTATDRHEVRHCYEGQYHTTDTTDEECYPELPTQEAR